jgi:NADH-quinone oxidoreductase subunit H
VSVLADIDLAYWQLTILRIVIALVAVLIPAGTIVYAYLFKAVSYAEPPGLMETGPTARCSSWPRWAFQKEDIFPRLRQARVRGCRSSCSSARSSCHVAGRARRAFIDLDAGAFYCSRCRRSPVIGILMALGVGQQVRAIGGIRAAGQLIAYELPLVLAVSVWSSRPAR